MLQLRLPRFHFRSFLLLLLSGLALSLPSAAQMWVSTAT